MTATVTRTAPLKDSRLGVSYKLNQAHTIKAAGRTHRAYSGWEAVSLLVELGADRDSAMGAVDLLDTVPEVTLHLDATPRRAADAGVPY